MGSGRPGTATRKTQDASIDRVLEALADPVRRRVVEELASGPRRAGELVAELDVPFPALSRHLRLMRRLAMVIDEAVPEDARGRRYRLNGRAVEQLSRWLKGLDSGWREPLARFKRYAEGAAGWRGPDAR